MADDSSPRPRIVVTFIDPFFSSFLFAISPQSDRAVSPLPTCLAIESPLDRFCAIHTISCESHDLCTARIYTSIATFGETAPLGVSIERRTLYRSIRRTGDDNVVVETLALENFFSSISLHSMILVFQNDLVDFFRDSSRNFRLAVACFCNYEE